MFLQAFRRFVSEEIGIKVVRAKATSDCFAFPLTQLSIMLSCEVDLCFTAISISDRFEIRVWPARYGGVNTASS